MRRFLRAIQAIATIALAIAGTPASAAFVIGAVGISSDHGDRSTLTNSNPLVDIIDQSALSQTYVSGVTDFDSYVAATTGTLNGSSAGTGYVASPSKGPVVFTFDLGAVYNISGIAIWNSNPLSPNSPQQPNNFVLYADNDGNPGNGLGTQVTSGSLNSDPVPASVFTFDTIQTRYIEFDALNLNSPGFSFFGLNEVVFDGSPAASVVPEPGTLPLMASALLLAGVRRRRRR